MKDASAPADLAHWTERVDLAAAFRWTARLDMHEGVANHFSLSIGASRVLMNPNLAHFARIRARDLIEVDPNDPGTLSKPGAPAPTAWGLHGGLHRACRHAACAMHVHSPHATVLACLKDKRLPPIDQTTAMFFDRVAIDESYGGLALGDEGARCAALLDDPKKKVLVMGNHGVMVIGDTVAETFDRLYYFERACRTYIAALQTGQPLDILSDEIAEKVARDTENDLVPQAARHLEELKALLDAEGSDYAR
jgi:ribulose-5-phosphate 4-epimerase/fuculose-1-phosphate aldolase